MLLWDKKLMEKYFLILFMRAVDYNLVNDNSFRIPI